VVAPEAFGTIDLAFTGFETGRDHAADGGLTLHPGARRDEAAALPAALLPAWRASLGFFTDDGDVRRLAAALAAVAAGDGC
jgi:selenocysteine lyase/cysteine desulfurase